MANRLPLLVSFSDDSVQLIFGGSIKKMVGPPRTLDALALSLCQAET